MHACIGRLLAPGVAFSRRDHPATGVIDRSKKKTRVGRRGSKSNEVYIELRRLLYVENIEEASTISATCNR